MIGLAGSRVIVVDDDESEALPILKAFAKKGIPTSFFNATPEGLPSKNDRLTGVRLAILDMDLIGGGVPDESKVAALANTLSKILSPSNGPYSILAWTKHIELLEKFEAYIFSVPSLPKPISTVMLTKAECQDDDQFNIEIVSEKLVEKLTQISPLMLLQEWEGSCFAAATEVTNALALTTNGTDDDFNSWRDFWKIHMLNLIHAIAEADAGRNLDQNTCIPAFYNVLNPLHADRLENRRTTSLPASYPNEVLAIKPKLAANEKARINEMLHMSYDVNHFSAGNIYVISHQSVPEWIPSQESIIDDLMNRGRDDAQHNKFKQQLLDNADLILIEVSAACDHAQKNIRIPRFLVGLLVPQDDENTHKRIKQKANFIWCFGPAHLNNALLTSDANLFHIFVSSRHLVTCELQKTQQLTAFARFRGQVFTELQAWFVQQAARPGKVFLY